jgi:YVTN family beta-propeller protein
MRIDYFKIFSIIVIIVASGVYATEPLSPIAADYSPDGSLLYIAHYTASRIDVYDIQNRNIIRSIKTPFPPTGIIYHNDYLWVTVAFADGFLLKIDPVLGKILKKIRVGHGACAPTLSPDKKFLAVCNQFSDDVSAIDLNAEKEIARIPVRRQPTDAIFTPDGKSLFVTSLIPADRADADTVAAYVSVIQSSSWEKIRDIQLTNGSNALRDIGATLDGRYILVAHNIGRFQAPTTQIAQGWMNTSALAVIDAQSQRYITSVILDLPERGSVLPWGLWLDESNIYINFSGTHEFARINQKNFFSALDASKDKDVLTYNTGFMPPLTEKISIPGNGPRGIAGYNNKVCVLGYFTDTIHIYDSETKILDSHILNKDLQNNKTRRGEIYFHDAEKCLQKWQSCASCHPEARADGMNWDLLNDGFGNPKNCKSMLLAHKTPPAMSTGIRPDAETAVRAGFKHIQFTRVPEEHAQAVDEYLKSLTPVPGPEIIDGKLSTTAQRGKNLFSKLGCSGCHPAPLYTDKQRHQIGEKGRFDKNNIWDTPSLVEVWRTPPYLHDGRCATLREVITVEKIGLDAPLAKDQVNDLVAFLRSL